MHTSSMSGLASIVARATEIAEQRERCPRAARLSDDVQDARNALGSVPRAANNQEQLLYVAFLDGAIACLARDMVKGQEVSEDDEAYVRERLEKGGI